MSEQVSRPFTSPLRCDGELPGVNLSSSRPPIESRVNYNAATESSVSTDVDPASPLPPIENRVEYRAATGSRASTDVDPASPRPPIEKCIEHHAVTTSEPLASHPCDGELADESSDGMDIDPRPQSPPPSSSASFVHDELPDDDPASPRPPIEERVEYHVAATSEPLASHPRDGELPDESRDGMDIDPPSQSLLPLPSAPRVHGLPFPGKLVDGAHEEVYLEM